MKSYRFKARDARGLAVTGVTTGASANLVAERMIADGLVPLDIRAAGADMLPATWSWRAAFSLAPNDTDLVMMYRQLASLLRARVPLARAVRGVYDITTRPVLRRALRRVGQGIAAGQDLALAMQQEPRVFSRLAISLVHAGERVGRLDRSFDQIVASMQRERETRRAVWTALRYPIFVMVAMVAALLVLNTFAIPAFVSLFNRLGTELPLATRILISVSDAVARWGPLLCAALMVCVVLVKVLPSWSAARGWVDRWRMRIPVVGEITRLCIMARFCRSWAMLLEAGQPVLGAVGVTAEVVDNVPMRKRLMTLQRGLRRGQSLSEAAQGSGVFDPLVVQMLSVGEVTGNAMQLIEDVGLHYEEEARYKALRMADALQPAILILLGAMVGLLAAGVYLPMLTVMSGYS